MDRVDDRHEEDDCSGSYGLDSKELLEGRLQPWRSC
jgi:hypothetical protein